MKRPLVFTQSKIQYSPMERKLLRSIAGKKKQTISKLVPRVYKGRPARFAATSVAAALRSLQVKMKRNREQQRLYRSELRGPHPAEYWIE